MGQLVHSRSHLSLFSFQESEDSDWQETASGYRAFWNSVWVRGSGCGGLLESRHRAVARATDEDARRIAGGTGEYRAIQRGGHDYHAGLDRVSGRPEGERKDYRVFVDVRLLGHLLLCLASTYDRLAQHVERFRHSVFDPCSMAGAGLVSAPGQRPHGNRDLDSGMKAG